jgi:hypothetical protein
MGSNRRLPSRPPEVKLVAAAKPNDRLRSGVPNPSHENPTDSISRVTDYFAGQRVD